MECQKCHQDFPESAFEPSVKRPGKLKPFCRPCLKVLSDEAKAARRKQLKFGKGNDYKSRNQWLKEIGFGSYREYLASDLWKVVRDLVFQRKGRICYLCGNAATELHHNRYHVSDLTGKRTTYIHPICHGCHEAIEFNADGDKNKLSQAKKAFRQKRKTGDMQGHSYQMTKANAKRSKELAAKVRLLAKGQR